jgi:hypothetical protein
MDESFGFEVKCPYCGNIDYIDFRFSGVQSKPVRSVDGCCGKVFHAEASLEKHIKTYEPVHVEFD